MSFALGLLVFVLGSAGIALCIFAIGRGGDHAPAGDHGHGHGHGSGHGSGGGH